MKGTRYTAILILQLSLMTWMVSMVTADHWSSWSAWSKCSRLCDGGASYQLRKCLKSFMYFADCKGERIRYRICNNQLCDAPIGEFRAKQCSAYNDLPYRDNVYQWVPFLESRDPCSLKCQSTDKAIKVTFAPKVLDGTRCSDQTLDMCINGKCWTVGCDHMLGSKKRLDSCGVCGGNNSCAKPSPSERYTWKEGAYVGCTVSCGVGNRKSVVLCWDKKLRKPAENPRLCDAKTRPVPKRQSCFLRPCPAEWRVSLWQPCSKSCAVGTTSRKVGCAQELQDRSLKWLEDSECPGTKPLQRKACNTHICPTWYAGKWSPCSVSCENGFQFRDVICRHVGEKYCDTKTKPQTKRECNTESPCYGRKADVIRQIPEREEEVQEISLSGDPDHYTDKEELPDKRAEGKEEVPTEPSFVAAEWSPCSKTCGEGVKHRYVRCKVYLRFLGAVTDLPDSECEGSKPRETERCYEKVCVYLWKSSAYSTCSHSCLGGVQHTTVQCMSNGTAVDDSSCDPRFKPATQRRLCNDMPCPPRWSIGEFGNCSVSCGGGIATRSVKCIQEVGDNKTIPLPPALCVGPSPVSVKSCNSATCKTFWWKGSWSKCSSSCGRGEQVRRAKCVKMLPSSGFADTKEKYCNFSEKPLEIRNCHSETCPTKIRIKEDNSNLFQLHPMKKLVLNVGGEASVLTGTKITIRCKALGVNKNSIVWLKNGIPIGPGKHVRHLKSGKVRIRSSDKSDNNTVFTCVVGTAVASLTLRVHTLPDAEFHNNRFQVFLQNRMKNFTSKKYLKTYPNGGGTLIFMQGYWSGCPAMCGKSGLQRRDISCEKLQKDFFKTYPLKYCQRQGLHRPSRKRSCIGDWKCDSLNLTNTSQCCRMDNKNNAVCGGQVNDTTTCTKTCDKASCLPIWKTSSWGKCKPVCGYERYKARSLACVWRETGLPAGLSCRGRIKPPSVKRCPVLSCSKFSCMDSSKYCALVKWLNMCRYGNYKVRCCQTCTVS